MIYTVVCNPAIDRTLFVDTVNKDDVTYVNRTVFDVAGKGINTAKVIQSLGYDVMCLGFVAGEHGEFVIQELDKRGIAHDFINVEGQTRENIKIIGEMEHTTLEFNEKGPVVSSQQIDEFMKMVFDRVQTGDIVVLSGSVPQGIPSTFYQMIITRCNEKEITTVLDASKELLQYGVRAKPTIMKPNLYELQQFVGYLLPAKEDLVKEAKLLIEQGIEEVIVSLGSKGCLYVDNDTVMELIAPQLDVVSTVGAGDAFVGGYVVGTIEQMKTEERLIFASSVAGASVMSEGTKPGSLEQISLLLQQYIVKKTP